MKILERHTELILIFCACILAGVSCGGGGGQETAQQKIPEQEELMPPSEGPTIPETLTGQFKDANVEGLAYVSGEQRGITDSNGTFTCKKSDSVTFSVGGAEIGTSDCKEIVTPVDVVNDGTSDSIEVKNIVKFLLVLDKDQDPSNGIHIPESVRRIAEDWEVNFSASDFSSILSPVVTAAERIYGDSRAAPDDVEAKTHLEKTFRCSYSGIYGGTYTGSGTYSGDRGGFVGIMVDASDGKVLGVGYYGNEEGDDAFVISSRSPEPISYDQEVSFAGEEVHGKKFEGEFTLSGVEGTWVRKDEFDSETFSGEGTFSAIRVGGSKEALYRYTAIYTDSTGDRLSPGSVSDNEGIFFSLDIDESDNVTGYVYKVHQNRRYVLNGYVSGDRVMFTVPELGATGSGAIDLAIGTLSNAIWADSSDIAVDSSGITGRIIGSGCRLN